MWGWCRGRVFSEFGVEVACVDTDEAKIARLERGEMPIYEPGLAGLVAANVAAGGCRSRASSGRRSVARRRSSPSARRRGAAMDTPISAMSSPPSGESRGRWPESPGYTVVVTKSTMAVGTGRQIAAILSRLCPGERRSSTSCAPTALLSAPRRSALEP